MLIRQLPYQHCNRLDATQRHSIVFSRESRQPEYMSYRDEVACVVVAWTGQEECRVGNVRVVIECPRRLAFQPQGPLRKPIVARAEPLVPLPDQHPIRKLLRTGLVQNYKRASRQGRKPEKGTMQATVIQELRTGSALPTESCAFLRAKSKSGLVAWGAENPMFPT